VELIYAPLLALKLLHVATAEAAETIIARRSRILRDRG